MTDTNGETAQGELKVEINDPPQAEDDAKIIKPNETATLTPKTTPGNSDIVDVAFADGSKELKVEGEGTWKIELKDGKVVSTFTPEADYDGKVTQQDYTITDENGLTASAKLNVTIIHTGLLIDKSAKLHDTNGNGKADAGETIEYTFVLTNTGNTVLTEVYVDDPMLEKAGIKVSCTPTVLSPGAQSNCASEKPYEVTAQDVKNGKVHNVATGHGTTPPGVPPIDPPQDEVDVPTGPIPETPGLAITGATMSYTLIAGAVALLIAGGVFLAARRKRHEEPML